MLLIIGILLTIFLGFLIVNSISVEFNFLEKVGLSFPLGLASQTFLMLCLDMFNIPLTSTSVLTIEVCAILCFGVILFFKRKEYYQQIKSIHFVNPVQSYNFVWLAFLIIVVYIEYMNFSKCMFFPPFDRDSLAGFESLGYAAAQEHTYKGLSLFNGDYVLNIHGPGSYITYLPMVQLSYAYVYLLGAETSKIIPALVYLFFLIAFYAVCSRSIGKTGAMIATFFVLITPEMIAFSSLSMTNVIHAVFASLGVIYIAVWLQASDSRGERKYKDLLLGVVLIAANAFCRTEGLVFIGAVCIALGIDAIVQKKYKRIILPIAICFIPQIIWTIYTQIYNLTAESIVITNFFWAEQKFETIQNYFKFLYSNQQYYGITFVFFIISLLSNAWFIIKRRDNLYLLMMIVFSSIFYYIVLYQIDYKWDIIENVLAYSAKRFMFCFIPIIWFFSLSNGSIKYLFKKLDAILQP